MKRIMSLRWLAGLSALLYLLAANAVAEPPANHTADEHGIMHAESKEYPGVSHCTDCHGSELLGGIGPSCYSCHTAYWRYFDPDAVTPPLDHTIIKSGVQHKPGHIDPMNSDCTLCHGANLNDGFAPSCFSCHDQLWGGDGPPPNHTELKGGFAEHKPGFGTPFESECTDCHGPNLDDGFGTSCFTCHGAIWAGGGPPEDHTETKGGFAEHKPGFGTPFDNGCAQCHGENLHDGFATSCFTCHEEIWAGGSGAPAGHTENRGGFADHMPGLGDPIANACTQCHGPNLNDGFGTSCYTCHEAIWAGSGPPSDHTELLMGFAEHKPGYNDPFANGCTQCHGPNLDDGHAFSCFTCHDNKWSDNQPPQIDVGGPYQVNPGSSITINASGTVDPNGDPMTFEWTFGDGSPSQSTGTGSSVSHTYASLGTYTGTVTVDDGVNPAVSGQFTVEVIDGPIEDLWIVNNTASPPETLMVTIEDHDGSLVIVMDDGVQSRLAYGIEFDRVIFWMELWMDVGSNVAWGVGDIYFGNIDRAAGTMDGVLFDQEGQVYTFNGVAQ